MEEKKIISKTETDETKESIKNSRGETYKTKKDWAEAAYQELADYIEEQGIYIRY